MNTFFGALFVGVFVVLFLWLWHLLKKYQAKEKERLQKETWARHDAARKEADVLAQKRALVRLPPKPVVKRQVVNPRQPRRTQQVVVPQPQKMDDSDAQAGAITGYALGQLSTHNDEVKSDRPDPFESGGGGDFGGGGASGSWDAPDTSSNTCSASDFSSDNS